MRKERRLLYSIVFNASIVAAEVIGGILSRSVALFSDAVHNSGDVLSLVFSYVAAVVALRGEDENYTYGYKRAEVVAALVNSVFITILGFLILFEALKKIVSPGVINPGIMLPVAIVGLLGNVLTILFLHGHHHDVNVRSALVHIAADTISSVFVVLLGILLLFKPWYFLDGVFSVVVSVYMIAAGARVFKESSAILMQVRPSSLSPSDVKRAVEGLEGVRDAHHIHLWTLDGREVYCELHAAVEDPCRADEMIAAIKEKLHEMGVSHATVQIEGNVYDEEHGDGF